MTAPAPDSDLIVIGAGPAGMAAAVTASGLGRKVILLDMQPAPGGQIYRNIERNLHDPQAADILAALGPAYGAGADLVRRFRAAAGPAGGIDYRPGTTVWDLRADGTVGWSSQGAAGYLRAERVILATGAMERPTPFPGWTLPGVMTAGAVQTLLKAGHLLPGGRIVLAGTGPLLFLLAHQLLALGVRPGVIAFTHKASSGLAALPKLRPSALGAVAKGLGWQRDLRRSGARILHGIGDLRAEGEDRVASVSLTHRGQTIRAGCDLLIVHDGITPATDLAHAAGIALRLDPATGPGWLPQTDAMGQAMLSPGPQPWGEECRITVTGDARLIGGAEAAAQHGRLAAEALFGTAAPPPRLVRDHRRTMALRPFLDAAFPPSLSAAPLRDETILCRCEELTAGDLRQVIGSGIRQIDQIRGLTRCGMGPCQGRSCSVGLARLIAAETGQTGDPADPVPFRARPPVRPLSLAALAGLSGLDPEAATPLAMAEMSGPAAGDAP